VEKITQNAISVKWTEIGSVKTNKRREVPRRSLFSMLQCGF